MVHLLASVIWPKPELDRDVWICSGLFKREFVQSFIFMDIFTKVTGFEPTGKQFSSMLQSVI
jgi:hypothetical protein